MALADLKNILFALHESADRVFDSNISWGRSTYLTNYAPSSDIDTVEASTRECSPVAFR